MGPIVKKRFFSEGACVAFEFRPRTFQVRQGLSSCMHAEGIDCSRTLMAQDASLAYSRDLEECRIQVEQSMAIMEGLIKTLPGPGG